MTKQQQEEVADAINVIANITDTEPMEITNALKTVALGEREVDEINEILCDL